MVKSSKGTCNFHLPLFFSFAPYSISPLCVYTMTTLVAQQVLARGLSFLLL